MLFTSQTLEYICRVIQAHLLAVARTSNYRIEILVRKHIPVNSSRDLLYRDNLPRQRKKKSYLNVRSFWIFRSVRVVITSRNLGTGLSHR